MPILGACDLSRRKCAGMKKNKLIKVLSLILREKTSVPLRSDFLISYYSTSGGYLIISCSHDMSKQTAETQW